MLILDLFFGRGGVEQTGKPNHNIINRDEFADLADHTLILLDRSNFRQFDSCLIWLGEEIRAQMQ